MVFQLCRWKSKVQTDVVPQSTVSFLQTGSTPILLFVQNHDFEWIIPHSSGRSPDGYQQVVVLLIDSMISLEYVYQIDCINPCLIGGFRMFQVYGMSFPRISEIPIDSNMFRWVESTNQISPCFSLMANSQCLINFERTNPQDNYFVYVVSVNLPWNL